MLRRAEIMQDVCGNFLDGALLGAHQHIGPFVSSLARGEQGTDLRQRIGSLKQRPVRLVFRALLFQ